MKKIVFFLMIIASTTAAFAQKKYTPARISYEEQLNRIYCTGIFRTDGIYFDLEHDNAAMGATAYINILDWLQGRVAGLQIHSIRGTKIPFIRNSPAAVFVNEVRMDPAFVDMMPVFDIAMIKVIKSPFVGGFGTGGAVAIYTKRGAEEPDEKE